MIRTVVFDIGRVLIGFEWKEYVHQIFQDPETEEKVTAAMFGSRLWNEMDRGLWNEEEVLSRFISKAPSYEREIREAFQRVGECTQRKDYAIPWIQELKNQGYQVLFLSNYSEHVKKRSAQALDFLPYLEGGVFSCDVHQIKPEPEIYETLLQRYQLNGADCVFLDDNPANIKMASKLGFHTVLFENYEQAYNELNKVLEEYGQGK